MSISSDSGGKLTLYYRDLNDPCRTDKHIAKTPDVKDGVQAVHDFVVNHFQLTDSTDKDLFSSVISLYPSSENIAFYRKGRPKVMHGVRPEGNTSSLKGSIKHTSEVVHKQDRFIWVLACDANGQLTTDKEFNFETLQGPRKENDCVFKKPAVALYNSNSFNMVVQKDENSMLALEAKDYVPIKRGCIEKISQIFSI